MASFRDELVTAIEGKLGKGAASRYSIEQLQAKLSLTQVSRETLRKILRDGHAPRRNVQSQLMAQLRSASAEPRDVPTADHFCGPKSAGEIRRLLSGSFFRVEPVPQGEPCDLVVTQFGSQKILFRCLDDDEYPSEGLIPEEYFVPALNHLAEMMDLLAVERAILITHTKPAPRAKDIAARQRISIENYDAFVQQLIDLPSVKSYLAERLKERCLQEDRFLSLRAHAVTNSGEVDCADSYAELLGFLDTGSGLAVASILGSYGSGKTSLALKVAYEIVERAISGKGEWVLPLWLKASASDLSDPIPSIKQDLLASLRSMAPNTHISIDTLLYLLRSGQAWLFVDGMDEAIALRSIDRLKLFLETLSNLCHPRGRIILSVRQEVFDDREGELAMLDKGMRDAGADRTLLLRMQSLELPAIEQLITSLRKNEPSFAKRLIDEIHNSAELQDLARRPIFVNIIANAASVPNATGQPSAVLQLFESYVSTWSDQERRRSIRLDLASAQRLEICEFMALYIAQYGEPRDGISSDEIRKIAEAHEVRLTIPNMEAFVMEARVAMFLERHADSDRFHFSHDSLRSFFLGRRLGRELARYSTDIKAARELERFRLGKADPVVKMFIRAKLLEMGQDPLQILERVRGDAVHGTWTDIDPRWESPFEVGPCFSFLVPNVVALLLYLRESMGLTTSPVDVSGAHLAGFDLDDAWGSPKAPLLLHSANLEHAKFGAWRADDGPGAIPPNMQADDESARRYCQLHNLLARSRFTGEKHGKDEFVLIPGGRYHVMQHREGEAPDRLTDVDLRSYLIQRYPVTNRQFAEFLTAYPAYAPEKKRKEWQNDWYLAFWPADRDDPRWKEDDWLDAPVTYVTWEAARMFAAASGLRLPTEVEWEVASRFTGASSSPSPRPWEEERGETPDATLENWIRFASKPDKLQLESLGSVYSAIPTDFSSWAAEREQRVPYFMVDYVREWVADRWHENYPCRHPAAEEFSYLNNGLILTEHGWLPRDGVSVRTRVLRGGSFLAPAEHCTSTYRVSQPELNANPDGSFRCVRPLRVTRPTVHGGRRP